MNTAFSNGCALGMLLMLGGPTFGGSSVGEAEELKITVCVYNYARVPSRTLRTAREKATWTFRQAGIEVDWADCTASTTNPARPQPSRKRLGPDWIAVSILPRSMTERSGQARIVFGMALQSPNGGFARSAHVFFDRVKEHAEFIDCSLPPLLAWVMTHEIGHLLLGAGSHSSTGIMREMWRRRDLKHAERRSLTFKENESTKLRAEVWARMEAANTVQEFQSANTGG